MRPVAGTSEANGLAAGLADGTAGATGACAGCGAPLALDQRYCLACGRPASPVRLAFLDVLQGEYRPAVSGSEPSAIPGGPQLAGHYAPPPERDGLLGALRRYSGLLALVGVLLATLLVGLLVGHWITGGSGVSPSGKQVIEVKGLGGGALAAAPAAVASGTGSTGSGSSPSPSPTGGSAHEHSSAKEEAKEATEVKAAKAPPVVHKKTSSQSLQKLNKTTGKQHAKEVDELIKGDEPIETGH